MKRSVYVLSLLGGFFAAIGLHTEAYPAETNILESFALDPILVCWMPNEIQGENIYILDTRTEPKFLTAHLPGAYRTPGGQLAVIVTDIARERDVPILANCAGRTRSLLGV